MLNINNELIYKALSITESCKLPLNATHYSTDRTKFGQLSVHPLIDFICEFNNPFARQTNRLLCLIFKAYYLGNWPTEFGICTFYIGALGLSPNIIAI